MHGFKAETETGVKGAFKDVGKLVAGAFAIGGAVETVKKIGEAASEDQAAFAILDKTLKNAHASTTLYGKSVDELIKKQKAGFKDEDLASAFVRLISATHNTRKAYRDLGLAEDVALARHVGVAQAALAVSKAEQGSTTSLQRLGIVLKPVTAAHDALKRSHDEAVASGAKFSKQQDVLYRQALLQAKAQDAVASRTANMATLQRRFGGTTETFAKTAAGAWANLQEQVHLFEVFIAERFLPGFTSAVTKVGNELSKLSANKNFRNDLNTIFADIHAGANAVIGPLKAVASAAEAVDQAVGGRTILAAVVAYKAFGFAVGLAESAQKKWAAARAAAAAAQLGGAAAEEAGTAVETAFAKAVVASAAAQIAATEALIANSAARAENAEITALQSSLIARVEAELGGDVAILAADTAATEAVTAAKLAYAEALAAVGAATAASSAETAASVGVTSTLRAGMLSLVGGPVGALTLGVAGLAAGIVYLSTRETAWDKVNREAASSLGALNDAIERGRNIRQERRDNVGQTAQDLLGVREARLGVARAQQALATTTAARGSLEYQQAVLSVAEAVQQYRRALHALADDQRHAGTLAKDQATAADTANAKLRESSKAVYDLAAAYRQKAALSTGRQIPEGGIFNETARNAHAAAKAVDGFVKALEKDAAALQKLHPLAASNAALLAEFTQQVGRLPTKHETRIILSNRDATATLQEILTKIFPAAFANMKKTAVAGGVAAGDAFWTGLSSSLGGPPSSIFDSVGFLLSTVKKDTATTRTAADKAKSKAADAAAATALASANAADSAVSAARDNLAQVTSSATDAINQARQSVADAQQSLADTIRQGQTQITDAVISGKQNLFSIGQKLASDIQSFLDKQGSFAPLTSGAAKQFQKLAAQIKAGAGGPDIQRQATALSAQLQGATAKQALAAQTKQDVGRQVNDLVDVFAKGPQNAAAQKRFNAGLAKILKVDHVTRAAVVKEFGIAFWDDLQAQIVGARKQAAALGAGPRRKGTGQEPSIVRPEQTVIDVQRQIAAAQRQVAQSQLAEAKTQTQQLKDIAKATTALNGKVKAQGWAKTNLGKKAQAARDAKTYKGRN